MWCSTAPILGAACSNRMAVCCMHAGSSAGAECSWWKPAGSGRQGQQGWRAAGVCRQLSPSVLCCLIHLAGMVPNCRMLHGPWSVCMAHVDHADWGLYVLHASMSFTSFKRHDS